MHAHTGVLGNDISPSPKARLGWLTHIFPRVMWYRICGRGEHFTVQLRNFGTLVQALVSAISRVFQWFRPEAGINHVHLLHVFTHAAGEILSPSSCRYYSPLF